MSENPDRWAAPQPVTDVQLAFPAGIVGTYLPLMKELPEAFRDYHGHNPWLAAAGQIFSVGIPTTTRIHLKEGVDGELALRHLRVCLGSYEPRHEHKIAGVGWLMSRWFDAFELNGIRYETPAPVNADPPAAP